MGLSRDSAGGLPSEMMKCCVGIPWCLHRTDMGGSGVEVLIRDSPMKESV